MVSSRDHDQYTTPQTALFEDSTGSMLSVWHLNADHAELIHHFQEERGSTSTQKHILGFTGVYWDPYFKGTDAKCINIS